MNDTFIYVSKRSYPSISTGSKNAGANYKDGSVVVDGKIVTSRNPNNISNFINAIAQKLIS